MKLVRVGSINLMGDRASKEYFACKSQRVHFQPHDYHGNSGWYVVKNEFLLSWCGPVLNCPEQPFDVSVNKAAKEFLRSHFQERYSEKISL